MDHGACETAHHSGAVAENTLRGLASFSDYFSQSGFMPHGHCYLWKPGLVFIHVASDLMIGIAYFTISLLLYRLVQKIKIPFSSMVLSFGIFIGACGATHLMEVWNLWNADYWVGGAVKVITALASVSTGVWLFRLRTQIIQVARSAKLAEERRTLLEQANARLQTRTEELMRANELMEQQQKALAHSAKMSALGEMAGGIAHEINSPLSIITLHANQLERMQRRGTLTPEELEKETKLISNTAMRIGEIIKGLRSFAREGESDPFEQVAVSRILQDALVLCQTRFRHHHIRLDVDTVPDNLFIECRAVQIAQVLINLLNNAHDAVISLRERWVKLEVKDLGERVQIAITDSGLGIPPSIAEKIMQPFFTTKEVGKGTGLGLSISSGIAISHNGRLELDSSSTNTRFLLTLPKQQPEKSE